MSDIAKHCVFQPIAHETIQVSNDTVKPNIKHCLDQPIAHETLRVSNDTVKPNMKPYGINRYTNNI
ncbi:hypothetical protein C7212DRAFT_320637, partial [Tuber magnatum]